MGTSIKILDAHGREIDSRTSLAHYRAAESNPLNGHWNTSRRSADAAFLPERWQILYRIRERMANDPFLRTVMMRRRQNVIGRGITVRSSLDYERIGLSESQAEDIENDIDILWDVWMEECDYSGNEARRQHFFDLLNGWYDAEGTVGDNIILPKYVERPGYTFKFCIQTPETDRVRTPEVMVDPMRDIRDGVEIGPRGEVVAIYVANQHPGGSSYTPVPVEYQRIRAIGRLSGRAQFWHNFVLYRHEATRGEPVLAVCLSGARHLSDYVENEQTRASMAALVGIIFKSALPFTAEDGLDIADRVGNERDRARNQIELYPGMVWNADPGDEPVVVNPNLPGPQFSEFTERLSAITAGPTGLTREQAINAWNGMSFSAAKASRDESQRGFICEQQRIARNYVLPPRSRVIEEAWMRGMLNLPGFQDPMIRREYLRGDVYTHPWNQLEELKYEQARQMRLSNGLTTLATELGSEGKHYKDVMDQQAREKQYARKLGLPDPHAAINRGGGGGSGNPGEADAPDSANETEKEGAADAA